MVDWMGTSFTTHNTTNQKSNANAEELFQIYFQKIQSEILSLRLNHTQPEQTILQLIQNTNKKSSYLHLIERYFIIDACLSSRYHITLEECEYVWIKQLKQVQQIDNEVKTYTNLYQKKYGKPLARRYICSRFALSVLKHLVFGNKTNTNDNETNSETNNETNNDNTKKTFHNKNCRFAYGARNFMIGLLRSNTCLCSSYTFYVSAMAIQFGYYDLIGEYSTTSPAHIFTVIEDNDDDSKEDNEYQSTPKQSSKKQPKTSNHFVIGFDAGFPNNDYIIIRFREKKNQNIRFDNHIKDVIGWDSNYFILDTTSDFTINQEFTRKLHQKRDLKCIYYELVEETKLKSTFFHIIRNLVILFYLGNDTILSTKNGILPLSIYYRIMSNSTSNIIDDVKRLTIYLILKRKQDFSFFTSNNNNIDFNTGSSVDFNNELTLYEQAIQEVIKNKLIDQHGGLEAAEFLRFYYQDLEGIIVSSLQFLFDSLLVSNIFSVTDKIQKQQTSEFLNHLFKLILTITTLKKQPRGHYHFTHSLQGHHLGHVTIYQEVIENVSITSSSDSSSQTIKHKIPNVMIYLYHKDNLVDLCIPSHSILYYNKKTSFIKPNHLFLWIDEIPDLFSNYIMIIHDFTIQPHYSWYFIHNNKKELEFNKCNEKYNENYNENYNKKYNEYYNEGLINEHQNRRRESFIKNTQQEFEKEEKKQKPYRKGDIHKGKK